jgi:hypothetical protein
MNKQLLDMKHKKEKDKKQDKSNISQDISRSIHFVDFEDTDENNIDTSTNKAVNISHLIPTGEEENLQTFEQYKKECDKNFEEKKRKLVEVYSFKKVLNEAKVKMNFENRFKEIIDKEKEKHNSQVRKRKEELDRIYKEKLSEKIRSINDEKSKENEILNNEESIKINDIQNKISLTLNDITQLKFKLNENKNLKSNTVSYSRRYETEVRKLENTYELQLKQHSNTLDNEFTNKAKQVEQLWLGKRNEYEGLMNHKNLSNQETALINESLLREKKNDFQDNLVNQYLGSFEYEKEEAIKGLNLVLSDLKENYDYLKEFYSEQKLLFKTEQTTVYSANLLNKIKTLFDNKNSIFRNLLDNNYYILKKKLSECENLKELNSLQNKDQIVFKIIETLTLIFYSNLYEYLNNDLQNEKNQISDCLEHMIECCEKIISNFNFDKKVQLNMLVCNPNFNS